MKGLFVVEHYSVPLPKTPDSVNKKGVEGLYTYNAL